MIERVMIVVAAGSSLRFGADKVMAPVAGLPLVAHTVSAVREHVDRCVLVCREGQIGRLGQSNPGVTLVPGGPTRTASEMAGLDAIGEMAGLIGVHDGARPLVTGSLVATLFETAARVGGAIPVLEPVLPLVGRSDLHRVPRAAIAQTPQVFRGEQLLAAYAAAARVGYVAQDTAEIAHRFGGLEIAAVPGDAANLKVTTPGDMETVRAALETSRNETR